LVRRATQAFTNVPFDMRGEAQIADARSDASLEDLSGRFEAVVAVLRELDLERVWESATEQQRRVLIDELLDGVASPGRSSRRSFSPRPSTLATSPRAC